MSQTLSTIILLIPFFVGLIIFSLWAYKLAKNDSLKDPRMRRTFCRVGGLCAALILCYYLWEGEAPWLLTIVTGIIVYLLTRWQMTNVLYLYDATKKRKEINNKSS